MKFRIIILSVVLLLFIAVVDCYGGYSDNFFIDTRVESGVLTEFTLEAPMNLRIHTYSSPGSYSNQNTSLYLYSGSEENLYASAVGVPSRPGTQEPGKAYLFLDNVPAGTYYVRVVGSQGNTCHLLVHGYPLDTTGSTIGSDSSLALDAGTYSGSFHFSHQRNMAGMPYTYSGDPVSRDMFYRFTLNHAMYVVIDHWGSPLAGTLPDIWGAYTRLTLYTMDGSMSQYAYAQGSDGIAGQLLYRDWIPEADTPDKRLAAWSGTLPAGTYWVLTENGYLSGSSVTTYYDGIIRTSIHGLCLDGSSVDTAIPVAILQDESFSYTDNRDMSQYQGRTVYYRLHVEAEGDYSIEPYPGARLRLYDSDGITVLQDSYFGLDLPSLQPGTYLLSLFDPSPSSSITIRWKRAPRPGQTSGNPIVLSASGGPVSYQDRQLLYYYTNGPVADADINYRLIVGTESTVAFDHRGTTSDTLGVSLCRQDSTVVFTRSVTCPGDIYPVSLPAGTYIYKVASHDKSSFVYTGIRNIDVGTTGGGAVLPSSSRWNRIVTRTATARGVTFPGESNSRTEVAYYDLLGRPLEVVRKAASPYGQDIISLSEYKNGRPVREWAHVALSGTGNFTGMDTLKVVSTLQSRGDTAMFSRTEYEESILNRVVGNMGSGQPWHSAEKKTITEYLVNADTSYLLCQRYTVSGAPSSIRLPQRQTPYHAGTLSVTRVTDEDSRVLLTFTDAFGHTVLERQMLSASTWADTYYVYDARHLLAAVIPPSAASLCVVQSLSQADFELLCWAYGYDGRRRCIRKMEPGGSVTRQVYGLRGDRLFSQTAAQRQFDEWTCTIPDLFGRPAMEMLVTGTESAIDAYTDSDLHVRFDTTAVSNYCYQMVGTEPVVKRVLQVNWYDSYQFLDRLFPQERLLAMSLDQGFDWPSLRGITNGSIPVKGLQTGSLINTVSSQNTDDLKLRVISYDHYGHEAMRWEQNVLGGESRYGTKYDFTGNVLSSYERHTDSLQAAHIKRVDNRYDFGGHLLETVTVADGDTLAIRSFGYTPTGEVESVRTMTSGVDQISYTEYNARGWLTRKKEPSQDMVLRYESPLRISSSPQWGGNISEWDWTSGTLSNQNTFGYDKLSRLISSAGRTVTTHYEYDLGGNMTSRTRITTSSPDDPFSLNEINGDMMYYSGNRLAVVLDIFVPPQQYHGPNNSYDASGRMTYDVMHNLSLVYNHMDRVKRIRRGGIILVDYTYLADGTKISALDMLGNGLFYLGSMTYRKDSGGTSLESMSWDGGRIEAQSNGALVPMLYSTDHLGSVRVIRNGVTGTVTSVGDYGDYGDHSSLSGTPGRFLYNGKESQGYISSLVPYLDYGARMLDPSIGRWISPDPLGEKYYRIGQYVYCGGNPISLFDDGGKDIVLAGKDDSSVTVKTDLIDVNVDVSRIGINWGGQYQLEGEKYLSAALDVAGIFDPSGISDIVNAGYQFSKREIFAGAMSLVSAIPGPGDVAKLTRVGKDVRILSDAVSLVDKGGGLTKSLRANMIRAFGSAPDGAHAHHILPKKFKDRFDDVGLNINDPQYGAWLESHHHLSKAREYNAEWEAFFKDNPNYTSEQVLEEAKLLMLKIYGK